MIFEIDAIKKEAKANPDKGGDSIGSSESKKNLKKVNSYFVYFKEQREMGLGSKEIP